MDSNSLLTQSHRTASRSVNGRAVVVVIDTQELFTLNEVGSFVWERADGRPISSIVDELATVFDVERERAEADVTSFAEHLASRGALRIEDSR